MKKLLLVILIALSLACCKPNDEEPTQHNDWLIGKWSIENYEGEYINFTNRDIFIMNDSLTGSYEIQTEDDKTIWFYVISDSEEFEEDGEMIFSDIKYHKSMMVEGMPLHEEEIIKLNYTK